MNRSNWLKRRTLVYNPQPHPKLPKKGPGSRAWYVIKKSFKRTCTVIGGLVLFSAAFSIISTAMLLKGEPLPDQMILFWPIEGSVSEVRQDPGLSPGLQLNLNDRPTLHQIVGAIDAAKKDERVKSLVVSFRSGSVRLAHIEELRSAVSRFRSSGKPALFYATDMTGGLNTYYLASAFDEIWMQPVGTLLLGGINMQTPYIKDLLDRLGISASFFRREEYKTVYESVTDTEMSPPHREMVTNLVNDLGNNISTGIARARDMEPERVKELVDMGLLTDIEAFENGLIDHLDYGDILVENLKERLTGNSDDENLGLVSLRLYERRIRNKSGSFLEQYRKRKQPEVAVVYVSGIILPDASTSSPPLFPEGGVASALDISSAIKDATDDPAIKAIVLRVDTPGGSPTASESIRWAIIRATEKGKPVYVSMGPVAASGGYWISASANRIFAQPSTLTGSIGVVSGKLVLSGMWKNIDVNWDGVSWGDKAGMWSFNTGFSPEETRRMNAMLDSIYGAFLEIVADGRGMTTEEVEEVARGYVWTGSSAVDAGLVDELGGLDAALDYTARSLGMEDRKDLDIKVMPKPKTPAEILIDMIYSQARLNREMNVRMQMFDEIASPLLREASNAGNSDLKTFSPIQAP